MVEVKTVLASMMFALAAYQLVLAAVGYGKLRPRILGSGPAFLTHRASVFTLLGLTWLGSAGAFLS